MKQIAIKFDIYELEALKSALQLLSKKEQKLMESDGKVSFNRVYNKLQSAVEDAAEWSVV